MEVVYIKNNILYQLVQLNNQIIIERDDNVIPLTNYLVRKRDEKSMIPGTHQRGFEVIQDTESKKWAIVIPNKCNSYSFYEMDQVLREYTANHEKFCVVETQPINIRDYPGSMGDIFFQMDRIVDPSPVLAHTYTDINFMTTGDPVQYMIQDYQANKEVFKRISTNNRFITFNLSYVTNSPGRIICEITNGQLSGTPQFGTRVIDLGIVGFRVAEIYSQLRVLCPDIMTVHTAHYLTERIIQKYLIPEDPNWCDYPSLVGAFEMGISPLGLVNIKVREPFRLTRKELTTIFSYTPTGRSYDFKYDAEDIKYSY